MTNPTAAAFGFHVNAAGHLEIGGVDALDLARQFGTPLHLLDETRLRGNCSAYREALVAEYGANARALFASKACCIVATCQIATMQQALEANIARARSEEHT